MKEKDKKEEMCNRKGCGKKGTIQTRGMGWFCSEDCRKEIETNLFKVLYPHWGYPINKKS